MKDRETPSYAELCRQLGATRVTNRDLVADLEAREQHVAELEAELGQLRGNWFAALAGLRERANRAEAQLADIRKILAEGGPDDTAVRRQAIRVILAADLEADALQDQA